MGKKRVAVFFGGRSNEHEISVITGMLAVNLLREKYRVLPVYLPREGGMTTGAVRSVADLSGKKRYRHVRLDGSNLRHGMRKIPFDVALNCCHGGAGEDGTLAALLAWNGALSASPDLAVSAVFMDKTVSKIAARGLGIPVLPALDVREEEWSGARENVLTRIRAMGYPVVVKPARLGSSIGIGVARDEGELSGHMALAFRLDDGVLVEKYLAGKRDLNCAACMLGGEVKISQVEEPFSAEEILSFREKYEGSARRSAFPARIPEETSEKIRAAARLIYERFHIRGVVRADFLLGTDGAVYFNELNTVPGSLACYLFGESLLSSRDFLVSLVEEALSSPRREKELVHTEILSSPAFSGAKGCKRR